MIKIGYFWIETSFNITGRGIVAAGQIIEGIPKLGYFVNINIGGKEELLKITGVERGNPDEKGIIKFGLLLLIEDPVLFNYIAKNRLIGQEVNIFKVNNEFKHVHT